MIELLIGNIASGKSTFAKERAQSGAVIINDDALYLALHGGDYKAWDKRLKPLYKQLEMVIATTAVAMRRDIVVDRPNTKASTRSRWIEIAKALEVPIRAYTFTWCDPAVHAARRHKSDSRGLSYASWMKVAKRIDSEYEPISESEIKQYQSVVAWTPKEI